MKISTKTLWTQKDGNSENEYEDAFAHRSHRTKKRGEFLFAVADGATETSFSGLWAQILTTAFVEKTLSGLQDEAIFPLVQEWEQKISERTQDVRLSWYAEEKLRNGAFSSLVGLKINSGNRWRCTCVGDSCLFHIRDNQIIHAMPYAKSTDFNNHPALISTKVSRNTGLELVTHQGTWKHGDYFFLMTDAIAQCFLSDITQIAFFTRVNRTQQYRKELRELRLRSLCRNDDTTFMRVHIAPVTEETKVGLA